MQTKENLDPASVRLVDERVRKPVQVGTSRSPMNTRAAGQRGDALGLSDDEVAFYDALETNVTIDWTLRENVRAQLRVLVKRILRKYGYPPDKQEKATQTVLEQAALFSEVWAAA